MNAKQTKSALLHQIKLNMERSNCFCVGFGVNSGFVFKGKPVTAIYAPNPEDVRLCLHTWVNNSMRSTHGDEKTLTIKFLNAILDTLINGKGRALDNATLMLANSENGKYLNEDGYLSFEEVGSVLLSPAEEKKYGFKWIDGVQVLREGGEEKLLIWVSTDESLEIFSKNDDEVDGSLFPSIIEKTRAAIDYERSHP